LSQLSAFQPTGPTQSLTAAGAGSVPTPLQAYDNQIPTNSNQYMLTNEGTTLVFVAIGNTAAAASAAAVVPTNNTQTTQSASGAIVYPLYGPSQVIITAVPGAWFTGITRSGTQVFDVTPGVGL
jgi:hypothetical protein